VVILSSGGMDVVWQQVQAVNPQSTKLFSNMTLIGFLSLIAWGLGYAGQPHILARFMAVESPQKLVAARRIAMVWMILVLFGSVATGLAGIAYFADNPLENPETVFITLSQQLFNPWVAGIITAAILSAIMSTVDSQLLVSSSVISEDFYRVFVRPQASEKELLMVSRGAVTVVVWSNMSGGLFELYEIVPGFALASVVIVIITMLKPATDAQALNTFEEVEQLVKN
jgi:sodium/proline symporter